MGHRIAAAGGLRFLCHRVLKVGSDQASLEAGKPGLRNQCGLAATVYDAVCAFASARAWLVFGALFRLSQVAANTISAPTNTQICSGSP